MLSFIALSVQPSTSPSIIVNTVVFLFTHSLCLPPSLPPSLTSLNSLVAAPAPVLVGAIVGALVDGTTVGGTTVGGF